VRDFPLAGRNLLRFRHLSAVAERRSQPLPRLVKVDRSSDLFQRIRARHGHYCPMSTLGGRLGEAALQALGGTSTELSACYHMDTCAVDGIAVATGCLPENGRLIVRESGQHCLDLYEAASGNGVRAELTASALAQAAACRRLLDAGEDTEKVLQGLRSGPLADLAVLTPLTGENHA